MDKLEKIKFIRDLTTSVADELAKKVLEDAIPVDWDGHQLRELLYEKFKHERSDLFVDKRSRYVKRYTNDVIVNNL